MTPNLKIFPVGKFAILFFSAILEQNRKFSEALIFSRIAYFFQSRLFCEGGFRAAAYFMHAFKSRTDTLHANMRTNNILRGTFSKIMRVRGLTNHAMRTTFNMRTFEKRIRMRVHSHVTQTRRLYAIILFFFGKHRRTLCVPKEMDESWNFNHR